MHYPNVAKSPQNECRVTPRCCCRRPARARKNRMDRIRIAGGRRLKGEIPISGAKNAALPLMTASLLTEAPLILTNVPNLADVAFMTEILRQLGVGVAWRMGSSAGEGGTLELRSPTRPQSLAPYDTVRKMRASFFV